MTVSRAVPGNAAWSPVLTSDGSFTLAHPLHGETCHSRAGAWTQAVERYAAPCRLRERAAAGGELTLLDIGTGLGLNLAAAVAALADTDEPPRAQRAGRGARLRALTLERDPAVIESALALGPRAAGAGERWHAPVRDALARLLPPARASGRAALALDVGGVPLALELRLGDARATLAAPAAAFDAVFLDPFSPRREPDLWSAEFLATVARAMRPDAWLSTYTVAFAVRVALARAGLCVGTGPRVGTKAAGTLASRGGGLPPLDPRTARRLARAVERGGE